MKAGDLFFAAVTQAEGLQRPGAHGIDRAERVALTKQELAFLQWSATLDDFVQRIHVLQVQRKWQAERGQAAILAMGLTVGAQFHGVGHFLNPCGKTHIRRKGNPARVTRASLRQNGAPVPWAIAVLSLGSWLGFA